MAQSVMQEVLQVLLLWLIKRLLLDLRVIFSLLRSFVLVLVRDWRLLFANDDCIYVIINNFFSFQFFTNLLSFVLLVFH